MTQENERMVMEVMKKIIRIGVVHSFDASNRTARVKFESLGGIVSAPINVVSRPRSVVPGQKDQTGDKTAIAEGHTHAAYVTDWTPRVNSMVLCIFMPDGGGDGYVIGEV